MTIEKDRLGQTLHDAEAALEDQWARQHDAELLQQIRRKMTSGLHCLKCGKTLEATDAGKTQLFVCPQATAHGWTERRSTRFPKVDHQNS